MTAVELIKRLEAAGWIEVRQDGSHRTFKKSGVQKIISVPIHGKKDLKPGLLNALLKVAGLKK